MSFTVDSKTGPALTNPSGTSTQDPQQSAKARAIAALMSNQGQAQQAVPNQNSVSPEELKAARSEGQSDTSVTPTDSLGAATEASEGSKPKEPPISDKYAALARRERQLRNDIRKFQADQAAAKAQPATPAFDESKYIPVDRLNEDLLGTLNERGYSYDKIVEQAINQQSVDPAVRQMLQRMDQQLKLQAETNAKLRAEMDEGKVTQRQQAVNQIRTEIQFLVKNDPNFETIRETKSIGDVVELIEKTFDQDGILLSVEEAAQAVEDHLLEEAMKLTKIGKIQQRIRQSQQAAASKTVETGTAPQQSQQSKTLTNTMSTARQLTARERAILAAKGELK